MWKSCGYCKIHWQDPREFLKDPDIKFIGMQVNLKSTNHSCLYHFDHQACGSTLGININKFKDLLEEPIPELVMTGEENCPRHCTHIENFLECRNECHNAPFRRYALKVLKNLN